MTTKKRVICLICLIMSILLFIGFIISIVLNKPQIAGILLCCLLFTGFPIKVLDL